MSSSTAYVAITAGDIMKRVVVMVSVKGRPSATSCIAVRPKLSCIAWTICGFMPPKIGNCTNWKIMSSQENWSCWNALTKKWSIFCAYCGVAIHWPTRRSIAAGSAVTADTSSSVGARPVSRFFTLVTAEATLTGSKASGAVEASRGVHVGMFDPVSVIPPASTATASATASALPRSFGAPASARPASAAITDEPESHPCANAATSSADMHPDRVSRRMGLLGEGSSP